MNKYTHGLRQLLQEGELKEALEKGLRLIKDKKINDEIFHLLVRLQNCENSAMRGLIVSEENRVEENRISKAFLVVLNKIEKASSLAEMNYVIALDHFQNNEFGKAIVKFEEAIEFDIGFEDAYLYRGICYLKLNNILNAVQDFDAALQINPFNETALALKKTIFLKLNEK